MEESLTYLKMCIRDRMNDNVLITLRFASGAIGNIVYSSMGSKKYPKEQLRVLSNGSVLSLIHIYGLYQLVASVVSYLNVLSLGFGSSYMRFYSRIKKDGDEKKVASFNGMYLTVFLIIAAICMFCGIVLVQNIQMVFGSGLTANEYPKARILLALMVFNRCV